MTTNRMLKRAQGLARRNPIDPPLLEVGDKVWLGVAFALLLSGFALLSAITMGWV
jgi:hypothetical protein